MKRIPNKNCYKTVDTISLMTQTNLLVSYNHLFCDKLSYFKFVIEDTMISKKDFIAVYICKAQTS